MMESPSNEVLIDSEDMQCGHIYLHEPSMMLKFFCLYCEKTYDDINVYCKHLSEHVSSVAVLKENTEEDDGLNLNEEVLGVEYAKNESSNISYNDKNLSVIPEKNGVEEENSFNYNENSCSNEFYGYAEEELDEDEEESRQFLFDQVECADGDANDEEEFAINDESKINLDSNSISSTDSTENERTPAVGEEATDFENLIGNAKILKRPKVPPPPVKRKSSDPPVKTFKIITLKNQIEELYSMVKNGRTENAPGGLSQKNLISSIKRGIERTTQIIGETVITSLPVEIEVKQKAEKGSDEYKCHYCDKVFRNQHSLSLHGRAHYMESQGNVKVAHKCADCNKLFNKIKDLQLHIHKEHFPNGFKCKLCHKVLRSIGMLEVHMKKMHLEQDTFRCRLCGRTNFKTSEAFEEHALSHGDEEKFKCYICGRHYGIEGNLRQHVLRHAERKPERCVVCGKVTLRITQHMKIHSPRPTRLLQCSICNQTFAFSSALSRHTKVMHKLPRTGRIKTVRRDSINALKRSRKVSLKTTSNKSSNNVDAKLSENPLDNELVEPKKVIVEIIENVMNRKAAMDDYVFDNMDCTVARYETIAAVQSITSPTELS